MLGVVPMPTDDESHNLMNMAGFADSRSLCRWQPWTTCPRRGQGLRRGCPGPRVLGSGDRSSPAAALDHASSAQLSHSLPCAMCRAAPIRFNHLDSRCARRGLPGTRVHLDAAAPRLPWTTCPRRGSTGRARRPRHDLGQHRFPLELLLQFGATLPRVKRKPSDWFGVSIALHRH